MMHRKISRLNTPDLNRLLITWRAWRKRGKKKTIKGDRGGSANNPLMLKLVSL